MKCTPWNAARREQCAQMKMAGSQCPSKPLSPQFSKTSLESIDLMTHEWWQLKGLRVQNSGLRRTVGLGQCVYVSVKEAKEQELCCLYDKYICCGMLFTPNALVSMLSQGTFRLANCALSILNKSSFINSSIRQNFIEHILTTKLCHQKTQDCKEGG